MKPKASLRSFLALSGSALLAISVANADILYWDGATPSGDAGGGAGTWDNSTANWSTATTGGSAIDWDDSDFGVFGGTAATVNIAAGGVTVGGLTFNTTAYAINAGGNGLNFSSGTNKINLVMPTATTAATITGAVTGTGSNLVFSSHPLSNATLNFNGTSTTGWTGTTTINPNVTLALSASSQALVNTSAITLNGGAILLTNTATGSENTIDRISNTAAIASYGSGSITIANTATSNRLYSETIGAVTHYNGQLGLGFNTVQNQTNNNQTLNIGGLSNSGSTSTIAINSSASAGAVHGNSNIRVSGVSQTATNEIIGPWMTAGGVGGQSDWAVYTSDVVSGYRRIGSKGGTATAETSWTSSSATGNFNATLTIPTTITTNNKLTGNREVNTLRGTFNETGGTLPFTFDLATETINYSGHVLVNGDVVHFRVAPSGLTDNRPYYVINSVAGTSFQLSLTPGGTTAVDLTTTPSNTRISTGINLNGNTLAMNGYITSGTGSAAIGGGSASTITIPSNTTPGNLYLHGAANLWIDPSIKDNSAGLLTLVKSGTFTLALSGNNTYSGGTVINSGTINFATAGSWVSGQNITFGGSGTVTASVGALSGGILTASQGAVGVIQGSSSHTYNSTTGTGTIVFQGGSNAILALGNASGFTGNLQVSQAIGTSPNPAIVFSSLGDGGALQYGGGQTDANQTVTFRFNGSSAQTWNTRQVQILTRSVAGGTINTAKSMILENNSTSASATLSINTDLLNSADRTGQSFILSGSNGGNNAFNGVIGNSTVNGAALNVEKTGDGKWILGGTNTYTGTTAVNNGTLLINGSTSTSSAFTVAANATLGGTGDIGGSVTVGASGILSPGASIESLAAASLSMASGSTFAYEVANSSATGADLLAVDTTVSLTGVNLSLDTATLAALASGAWNVNDKITLISYFDAGSGITSGFTGYVDDTTYFFGSNEWRFNYNDTIAGGNYGTDAIAAGQNRFVTMTAVTVIPEPRAALLGGLGILMLLRRRRA